MVAKRRALRTVPNWLSLFRLLSAPLLAVLLMIDPHGLRVPIATLFAVASITDYLDGYLARLWGVVSQLGIFMDLAADKILVSTVLIMLVGTGSIPSWMAALIIAREFIVSGLRSHAAAKGMVISASQLGKWKTAITLPVLTVTLLEINRPLELLGLAVVTAITVLSGADYVRGYWEAELRSKA